MRNEYIADMCCDVPSMTVEKSSGGRWDSDRSAGRRCATGLGLPVIPLVIRKNIVPHLCDSRRFPGKGGKRGMSNMAMLTVLRRMKRDDVTPHGFRSAFRDWASERTTYGPEVAEMALAHAVGDKVEAAYRRGDLFTKRRGLMADWATFATAPASAEPGKVVSLRTRDSADSADTPPSCRVVRR